jgi:DNA-binding LacI/PurR family transcriptional regulator
MKVTLKQIAERAGVSIKTASNVINQREEQYSRETYELVMRAVEELGYVPNLAARHMRQGKLGIIALAVPDVLNPYFSELTQLVIQAAEQLDYTVTVHFTDASKAKEQLIINGSQSLTGDGIILDPLALDSEDIKPAKGNYSIVLLGERQLDAPYDHVMIDNVAAAKTATQHLIELGHRRIAPVGVTLGQSKGMPHFRFEGYRQAMEQAGLAVPEEYIVAVSVPRFDRRHGAFVMNQLLQLGSPPDAIFCFNDLMALGAMKIAVDHGLAIPDDMAVIGFDNIQEAEYSNPPLSTIAQDKQEIAQLAVSLLVERINGNRTAEPEVFQPGFSLIPRTSTIGSLHAQAFDELVPKRNRKQ